MNVSLKWLKEYTQISLPADELAERLTMAGLEVKAIRQEGAQWENVLIGRIIALEKHPNADRLQLVTVDLKERRMTVVTGAPNIRIGDKVPFALVGAELIDGHTGARSKLKSVKVRGYMSEGMVCSERELGISGHHEGIMVLPTDAPEGEPLSDYLGDTLLDLDITPNRPDCLSVVGVGREVAAITGQPITMPASDYSVSTTDIKTLVSVRIDDPEACPRYCASVITGVKIAPSPAWLQERLLASGMRPINNVVDVTNYVMLELGQPLHAFDLERLIGKQIVIRRPSEGEKIVSLDGIERELTSDMLVIADSQHPVAIAGVMGGLNSEVTDNTTTLVIESANFERSVIRKGSGRLGLKSEASIRFEKGISAELPLHALKRATRLILETAGGKAAGGIIDEYPGKKGPVAISLSVGQVKRLLGIGLDTSDISKALLSLGFNCQPEGIGVIRVTVPYWRTDIYGWADLVEEIARVTGYDRIPLTTLAAPIPERDKSPLLILRTKIRDAAVGCGFQEVITYSLVGINLLQKASCGGQLSEPNSIKLVNPMSREQEYLRPNLRGSLLASLAYNQKYETNGIRLFEIGKAFWGRTGDLPEEREQFCAVMNGPRSVLSWRDDSGMLDFFDAKGIVECLLSRTGSEIDFKPGMDEGLHPGRIADLFIGGARVGVVGELHPKVSTAFDLVGDTFLIEVDIRRLLDAACSEGKYEPLPRFPAIVRDIAIELDKQVPYQRVREIVLSFPLVREITLFDLYTGKHVPASRKSLAFRLKYQSPTETLTEARVMKEQESILARLNTELGAVLRSAK